MRADNRTSRIAKSAGRRFTIVVQPLGRSVVRGSAPGQVATKQAMTAEITAAVAATPVGAVTPSADKELRRMGSASGNSAGEASPVAGAPIASAGATTAPGGCRSCAPPRRRRCVGRVPRGRGDDGVAAGAEIGSTCPSEPFGLPDEGTKEQLDEVSQSPAAVERSAHDGIRGEPPSHGRRWAQTLASPEAKRAEGGTDVAEPRPPMASTPAAGEAAAAGVTSSACKNEFLTVTQIVGTSVDSLGETGLCRILCEPFMDERES
mmetsp:Transcript_84988/g.245766  ORF Transcript_84988/g.245766 Transcript_84988/m.245766 type:complete len:263 (+) Transcript_84988:429-1217(+)